jgi:serine/threonine protein kinase
MELYCTRPSCPKPRNLFPALNQPEVLRTVKQQFCTACGMPLILEGRYLATKILGAGGFGTAFLGRDRLTPSIRQCAIKQFRPAVVMNPEQLDMARDLFHREAEVLEQLGCEHPQIPNLFAFFDLPAPNKITGVDDPFFYLVQEFVEGENLEQELDRRGRFNEAEVLDILNEMLGILEFIHSHNVIHRDIKPSNIMRHPNGRLYLLDFGAIKNITKPGSTVIYSQGYAPPEQFRGQQVFFASDLYALAATCVVLLTNETHDKLFDTIRDQWQWENYAKVSNATAVVLNRMLQNAPFSRFQSVEETRLALKSDRLVPRSSAKLSTNTGNSIPRNIPDPKFSENYAPEIPSFMDFDPTAEAVTIIGRSPLHRLPLPAYLGHASFVGWQTGLLAIISSQFSLSTPILVMLGAVVLVYLQSQRMLNKEIMAVMASASGIIVMVLTKLDFVLFMATAMGGVMVAIITALLFRLVYRLLSGFNK